jgi:uncharacterized protein with FMN-binding domain
VKRILAALAGTIVAVALLLSYRTSLGDAIVALPGSAAHVAGSVQAGAGVPAPGSGPPPRRGSVPAGSGSAGSAPGGSAPTGSAPAGSAAPTAATVVDGATEQTPYGPVQVEVTVTGGRITQVTVLQQPNSAQRSVEINTFALPQLRAETLAAQSARIDAVSGATYTTEGYQASLQSALDAAHVAA